MKRPSYQFYPDDWLTDFNLSMCSLGAQGLWQRLMCYMHQGEPYGHLRVNGRVIRTVNLPQLVGKTPEEVMPLWQELQEWGVPSETSEGCIFSRRMVEDERKREEAAAQGRKGGNPLLKKGAGKTDRLTSGLTGGLTKGLADPLNSSSSSSSSSNIDHHQEDKLPPEPGKPPELTPLQAIEDYLKGRVQAMTLGGADYTAVDNWLQATDGNVEVICKAIDAGLAVHQKGSPGTIPRSARFYSGYVEKQWSRYQAEVNSNGRSASSAGSPHSQAVGDGAAGGRHSSQDDLAGRRGANDGAQRRSKRPSTAGTDFNSLSQ